MSVSEIEKAIAGLSKQERFELADWLREFMADEWDRQMEEDAKAGKLDRLAREADEAFERGECTPL